MDPNVFPALYDAQFMKASGTCVRLRGFEKPSQRRIVFQEWILDFHPDGRGHFDMTLDSAIEWSQLGKVGTPVAKPQRPRAPKDRPDDPDREMQPA